MPFVPLVGIVARRLPAGRPAPPRRARRRLPQTPRARGSARARPTARPVLAGGARVLSRAFGPVATLAVTLGGAVAGPLIGDYFARRILQRPGIEPTPFPKGPSVRSRPNPTPRPDPQAAPIPEITVSAPRARPLNAPRRSPLSLPRVSPVYSPLQRLSPLLEPLLQPRAAPRSSPVSSPRAGPRASPIGLPLFSPVLSPRDFLPAQPLSAPKPTAPRTRPRPNPLGSPSTDPLAQPQPQPNPQQQRCRCPKPKARKPRKVCRFGYFVERGKTVSFKPWGKTKCR